MDNPQDLLSQTDAQEVESAVLGALLIENDAYIHVASVLSLESFYGLQHKTIYKAIQDLWNKKIDIDILTVTQKLISDGTLDQVGGAIYISKLTNRIGTAANIESHARILKEREITRSQIRLAIDVLNMVRSDDYDALEANEKIAELAYQCNNISNIKRARTLKEMIVELTERIKISGDKDITGIPSGHKDVDRIMGGWQSPDLIVLAARPGMGKTALALRWSINAAKEKIPTVIFSLEMKDVQLITRVVSQDSGISSNTLRTGRLSPLNWQKYNETTKEVEDLPLTIIDNCHYINEIESKAQELRMKGELELMVIDYLQLVQVMGSRGGNREQEVSMITRKIKSLAMRLDVPIIALSQLSRSVESRSGDKRPILSDLRESGAIEQDADIVLFLYRPEYYDIKEDADGMSTEGLALLDVAKHRNGSLEEIMLRFIGELTTFEDYRITKDESQQNFELQDPEF